MRRLFSASLILSLIFLLNMPFAAHGEQAHPTSNDAASSVSGGDEDRGAGYLPYSDPTPLGSGGFFGAIVRTIFSLAIVIGLLYGTLWVIRRFTGGTVGPLSEGSVRVVGRIYLSPKVVIYFLKLADELLVIGTNAGNISLLTTITDEDQTLQIENALKSAHAEGSGIAFSRFFDKSMTRFQKALQKEDSVFDDQLRMLNDQIGRLKGLTRKKQRDEE